MLVNRLFNPDISQYREADKLILLVMDAPELLDSTRRHLAVTQRNVVDVAGVDEAIHHYLRYQPDIVVIDLESMGVNSFTLCSRLRELAADEFLSILLLVSTEELALLDDSFEAGVCDIVTKPLDWKVFEYRIRHNLRTKEVYLRLRQKAHMLLHAQQLAKIGYWDLDLGSMQLNISDEAARIMEIDANAQSLDDLFARIESEDLPAVKYQVNRAIENRSAYSVEHKIISVNKRLKIVAHQGEVVERRPGCFSLIVTVQDISNRVEAEELIRFKTFHDSLSGLPNKLAFSEQLDASITMSAEDEKLLAIFFVGMDRFKKVNNSYGHRSGDMLLLSVAERMNRLVKSGAMVSRFDGDVFAVQLAGISHIEEVESFATQINELMSVPFPLNGREVYLSTSMGISIYPMDGESRDELIKKADSAMHEASADGGGQYRYHTREMQERGHQRLILEQDLRTAIREFQLQVYFQPQVDARSNRIVGAEALLRWYHPQRGLISPDEFIPVAEEVGLINPIGMYVLESSCEALSRWNELGLDNLRVGINLSATQFCDDDLVNFIRSLVDVLQIAPGQLELEITERMAMSNFDKSVQVLRRLREIGVKTSMDDFGTGYSSLSSIQEMPIDTLKIDRSFVKNINGRGENGEIAKAIITMAHSLGLHTIAEGVETESQYQFLRGQGVDEIQGWYFGHAMPAAEFEQFVRLHKVQTVRGGALQT